MKLAHLMLGKGTWRLISNVLMVPEEEGAATILLSVGAHAWSVLRDGVPGMALSAGCHASVTIATPTPAELRGLGPCAFPEGYLRAIRTRGMTLKDPKHWLPGWRRDDRDDLFIRWDSHQPGRRGVLA